MSYLLGEGECRKLAPRLKRKVQGWIGSEISVVSLDLPKSMFFTLL